MRRRMVWSIGSLALMLTLIVMSARNVHGEDEPPFTLKTFTVPTTGSNSWGITAGPDGNLWFAESGASKIGRITPSGTITEFPIPTPNSSASSITPGPDGNLWFTENSVSKIGRITPGGTITEFPVPTTPEVVAEDETSWPYDIVSGPDGNLWFTQRNDRQIGRLTPDGTLTEFSLPADRFPQRITAGADGNLWFLMSDTAWDSTEFVGRLTPGGQYTELPSPIEFGLIYDIVAGPDDNLWMTSYIEDEIIRMTPAGGVTRFGILDFSEIYPENIVVGPDKNLWVSTYGGHPVDSSSVIRVAPDGRIIDYDTINGYSIAQIAAGPDGAIWFTSEDTIGRLEFPVFYHYLPLAQS